MFEYSITVIRYFLYEWSGLLSTVFAVDTTLLFMNFIDPHVSLIPAIIMGLYTHMPYTYTVQYTVICSINDIKKESLVEFNPACFWKETLNPWYLQTLGKSHFTH